MTQGWYGFAGQLQTPVLGVLLACPVCTKKAVGLLMSCYPSTHEKNVVRQFHSINIIYSCLDFPAKSQAPVCWLLRTHHGKITSVLRSLQTRHTKNSKERRDTSRSNLLLSKEQTQEDCEVSQYCGSHLKYNSLPLKLFFFLICHNSFNKNI